jgi:hypothetical protein
MHGHSRGKGEICRTNEGDFGGDYCGRRRTKESLILPGLSIDWHEVCALCTMICGSAVLLFAYGIGNGLVTDGV